MEASYDDIVRLLGSRRLLEFTQYTFPEYQVNWHHKALCDKLTDFADGKIKRLMVFMPPQHGKSELVSRRLPAFLLGTNPNLKIAVTSYGHSLATKFNRQVQRIIQDPSYQDIFPHVRIGQKKGADSYVKNSDEFEVVGFKGSLRSVGVGGGLTGNPVDIAIIDDPLKDAQEAYSQRIRDRVNDWYDSVLTTRLHNDSQILITLTRWHSEDLAGRILKDNIEGFEVLSFPAIKETKPTQIDPRKKGEALWPDRHSLDKLEKARAQNHVFFSALYQQKPTEDEDRLFKNLNTYENKPQQEPDGSIAFIDTADTGDDWLCLTHALIYGKKLYIDKVIMTQDPMEITLLDCANLLNEQKTNYCRVESNFGGRLYASELQKLCKHTEVLTANETRNKHTRIFMNGPFVMENCIFEQNLDKNFIDQIMQYSRIESANVKNHDDAIDSLTGLCNFVKGIFPERYE